MSSFAITKISVKNFKSLADFDISNLPKFVCLIGVNGAGKTTVLQVLGFVRAMMAGKINDWLLSHDMAVNELFTIGSEKRSTIEIKIEALIDEEKAIWECKFNPREMRCSYEKLFEKGNVYIFSSGKLSIQKKNETEPQILDFERTNYEGSIFSFILTDLSGCLRSMRLFGVLDPGAIAKSTRFSSNKIAPDVLENGENICGFIASLPTELQQQIFNSLCKFYPSLIDFKVRNQRFGWKSLLFSELEKTTFSASNLSYGTLRLFLLISQQYTQSNTIMFDEIENGFNQELFEDLVNMLLNYGKPVKQVCVTTHSGLFLNYLPDEIARQSVFFLYKDSHNHTKATRFFDIKRMNEKLNVLGPGEAMGDTNLIKLSEELRG